MKAWLKFTNWWGDNINKKPSQRIMLDYIKFLRETLKYKRSSIWKTYSILNTITKTKYSFPFGNYPRIHQYIKANCSEDVVKKASVFTQEDLRRMCHGEAGDEVSDKINMFKTVAIVSHHGATLRSKHVLTFGSEPELGHSAFHYPRLGNFISLFNKI